MNNRFMEN